MPQPLCGDGDPIDIVILIPIPLIPRAVIECRPAGVIAMTDEHGDEAKIIAVHRPHGNVVKFSHRNVSISEPLRVGPANRFSVRLNCASVENELVPGVTRRP